MSVDASTMIGPLALPRLRRAATFLARELGPSPLIRVDGWRASHAGNPILVKAECLMPTGSFKIRGATWRISLLTAEEHRHGVIAYSTGNHAQAVAKAAADVGIRARIVMSPDVPAAKIEATRRWGAEVRMADPSSEARRAFAEQWAKESGGVLIPPYDDFRVMEGQASVGLELLAQMKDTPPSAVFVPVGGGGLLAGVAAAIKQTAPSVRVIGVEPELENDAHRSFHLGQRVCLLLPATALPMRSRFSALAS